MKKKVYITRKIPQCGIDLLKNHFDVQINEEERTLTKEELVEKIKNADAVLTQLTDVIDKDVVNELEKVKIIANYAVGYNNIDVSSCKDKNIYVSNTPDVLSDTTAELAWALLFSVSRRIVEADRYSRSGEWKDFSPKLMLGQDITNKTLGIVGAGRIGIAFAKKSLGFDMKIIYHNRSRDLEFEEKLNAQYVDFDTLLKESDIISLHVPLTNETDKLIGEEEFNKMKNNCILINTARGRVVDENALINALSTKKIWGAGLDVYENEPVISEKLLKMDNVILTPHIGSASNETRNKMSMMAANNIIEVLNGNKPINSVY